MANCSVTRYPPSGKYIHLEADFGDKTGMLQICRIEVYARPVTSGMLFHYYSGNKIGTRRIGLILEKLCLVNKVGPEDLGFA